MNFFAMCLQLKDSKFSWARRKTTQSLCPFNKTKKKACQNLDDHREMISYNNGGTCIIVFFKIIL